MLKKFNKNIFLIRRQLRFSSTIKRMEDNTQESFSYMDQETSQKSDQLMMNEYGHSLEVLMELAGLSIAQAIDHANHKYHEGKIKNIAFLCGPGNNGGDGYVAARHLSIFGYNPSVIIFKKLDKPHFNNLLKALECNKVPLISFSERKELQENFIDEIDKHYELVVDCIFGFSFKGPLKSPYDKLLPSFKQLKAPIFSVDVPSGWEIEKGNVYDTFCPKYNISLQLPKICMKEFKGIHYLGGRFIPKVLLDQYKWKIPKYEGTSQFIEL